MESSNVFFGVQVNIEKTLRDVVCRHRQQGHRGHEQVEIRGRNAGAKCAGVLTEHEQPVNVQHDPGDISNSWMFRSFEYRVGIFFDHQAHRILIVHENFK